MAKAGRATRSEHDEPVRVNRAPVMTLWAAVVAERLGHDPDLALTLGQAVAVLNARSKGRRLGVIEPVEESPNRRKKARPKRQSIEVCRRAVPVKRTKDGMRAVVGDET